LLLISFIEKVYMKNFTLIVLFSLIVKTLSFGQSPVTDTHPEASIFAIDYQTGKETPANSDGAILFKDAFVDLVLNTASARMHLVKMVPGRKSMVILQVDPQTANGYQLTLESKFLGQTTTIYSYLYNIDQNTLFYYDPNAQNWVAEVIRDANVNNLNNCQAYSNFNVPQPQQAQAPDLSAGGALQSTQADNNELIDTAVAANTVPPPLPDYQQPECPSDGYLWQPGFWAYSPYRGGYYWVPGAWVAPPAVGLLWTPPYWGYYGGRYVFHTGYWGPTIGFYGGINYGYGYHGHGFVGGEWHEGHFRYNTAVVRVNTVVVHNTYVNNTVINNTVVNNRTSFNGPGGVAARPTPVEVQAMRQPHVMPTVEQIRNQQMARADKTQFASANGGRPANVATAHVPVTNTNQPANQSGRFNQGNNNVRPNNAGTFNNNNNNRQNMPAATNNTNNAGATNNRGNFPGANNAAPNANNMPNNRTNAPAANNNRPNGAGVAPPAVPQIAPGAATGGRPGAPGRPMNNQPKPANQKVVPQKQPAPSPKKP
jgi:hypothetical protein